MISEQVIDLEVMGTRNEFVNGSLKLYKHLDAISIGNLGDRWSLTALSW